MPAPPHPAQLQADLKRKAAQLDQAENEKHLLRNELASLKASQKELEQVRRRAVQLRLAAASAHVPIGC